MPAAEYVQCLALSKRMKSAYAESTFQLERKKAKQLENKNEIRIVENDDILDNIGSAHHGMTTANAAALSKPTRGGKAPAYLLREAFTRIGKKKYWPKIAWVQDYSKNGGAELSNIHAVHIGETLGFDIVGVSPSLFNLGAVRCCDLAILNNVFEFSPEQLRCLYWELFERRIPFVKYDHDMRELKKRFHKTRCLFERSRQNIFISPAHREAYRNEAHVDGVCFPLAIDVSFHRKNANRIKRKPSTVLVPSPKKARESVKRYIGKNKDKQFTVIGSNEFSTMKNARTLGTLNVEQMRDEYYRHEEVLHIPDCLWAGDRVYFEAQLCGCTVVANDNVGHKSWGFKKNEIADKLTTAPYMFWREIERSL